MNSRETAVWEIHQFITQMNIPYVIIGGMAVQHWMDALLIYL